MQKRHSKKQTFCSSGALRKCSSTKLAPSSNLWKLSKPIWTAIDKPIADQREYRPPTQSQNSNIFASSMPNSRTFGPLVDNATKCFATAALSWKHLISHNSCWWLLFPLQRTNPKIYLLNYVGNVYRTKTTMFRIPFFTLSEISRHH